MPQDATSLHVVEPSEPEILRSGMDSSSTATVRSSESDSISSTNTTSRQHQDNVTRPDLAAPHDRQQNLDFIRKWMEQGSYAQALDELGLELQRRKRSTEEYARAVLCCAWIFKSLRKYDASIQCMLDIYETMPLPYSFEDGAMILARLYEQINNRVGARFWWKRACGQRYDVDRWLRFAQKTFCQKDWGFACDAFAQVFDLLHPPDRRRPATPSGSGTSCSRCRSRGITTTSRPNTPAMPLLPAQQCVEQLCTQRLQFDFILSMAKTGPHQVELAEQFVWQVFAHENELNLSIRRVYHQYFPTIFDTHFEMHERAATKLANWFVVQMFLRKCRIIRLIDKYQLVRPYEMPLPESPKDSSSKQSRRRAKFKNNNNRSRSSSLPNAFEGVAGLLNSTRNRRFSVNGVVNKPKSIAKVDHSQSPQDHAPALDLSSPPLYTKFLKKKASMQRLQAQKNKLQRTNSVIKRAISPPSMPPESEQNTGAVENLSRPPPPVVAAESDSLASTTTSSLLKLYPLFLLSPSHHQQNERPTTPSRDLHHQANSTPNKELPSQIFDYSEFQAPLDLEQLEQQVRLIKYRTKVLQQQQVPLDQLDESHVKPQWLHEMERLVQWILDPNENHDPFGASSSESTFCLTKIQFRLLQKLTRIHQLFVQQNGPQRDFEQHLVFLYDAISTCKWQLTARDKLLHEIASLRTIGIQVESRRNLEFFHVYHQNSPL